MVYTLKCNVLPFNTNKKYCILEFSVYDNNEEFKTSVSLYSDYILKLEKEIGKDLLSQVINHISDNHLNKLKITEVKKDIDIEKVYDNILCVSNENNNF